MGRRSLGSFVLGKANDPVLIDHEPGALGPEIAHDRPRVLSKLWVVVQDPIGLGHLASSIAQQGIGDAHLFSECFIGIVDIYTHAQHLGTSGLELGQIKLEGQRFLRSGVGKRVEVEEHHHRLLAEKISQADLLSGGGGQREIRRCVTHV